jgi:hypothetical protein
MNLYVYVCMLITENTRFYLEFNWTFFEIICREFPTETNPHVSLLDYKRMNFTTYSQRPVKKKELGTSVLHDYENVANINGFIHEYGLQLCNIFTPLSPRYDQ